MYLSGYSDSDRFQQKANAKLEEKFNKLLTEEMSHSDTYSRLSKSGQHHRPTTYHKSRSKEYPKIEAFIFF